MCIIYYTYIIHTCDLYCIGNKETAIFLSTSGVGKIHYAIALGIAAYMKGKNVLFAHVPNRIIELKETMNNNQLNGLVKNYCGRPHWGREQ